MGFVHSACISSMVALLLLLALSWGIQMTAAAGEGGGRSSDGQCDHKPSLDPRPHSVSILEFGAVADGKTMNTVAFQNAIFYLKSFADKGGAQLYVPPGKWLTGSFNLTSHLTLFLAKGATILGSQGGIELRTNRGRGGYIRRVFFSNVQMEEVEVGLVARGDMGDHPDDGFDREAVPVVQGITFRDVVGLKVGLAGNFTGAEGIRFGTICLLNVTLTSGEPWVCSGVDGFSEDGDRVSGTVPGTGECREEFFVVL
ncbi:unnamed protein product [Linum tenue]|uniref:Rhamnogalacturonase A/B/Epimerase-like pectate lyase domain-containing protein n=1 Tax=Linum tenue TaxID=586396 RepID=A0AAV0S2J5_9ROSI|nr:unnamed protein product [Linum tenue]